MERTKAIVLAVLLVGYSLYGVLFVGVGMTVSSLGDNSDEVHTDARATDRTNNSSSDSDLEFQTVGAAVGFTYQGVRWSSGTQAVMSDTGVYATDYNNDGWTDVLALGGGSPILFQNDGGTFERSGVLPAFERHARTALFFDADNDGWQDLLVLSLDHDPLLLENRRGEFVPREDAFEGNLSVPIGATAGDYNADGCADVFIIQNGDWTSRHPVGEGRYTVPDGGDNGNPNRLYRGDCNGGFENVTEKAGIQGARWSLATSMVDITGDGYQDIYVANDFNHDVLYRNNGNGTFTWMEMSNRTNRNGMSAEVGDVNEDHRPDLFVTNIYFPETVAEKAQKTVGIRAKGHNLLINRGNGRFEETAKSYGVRRSGWGWAAVLGDLDNDMDEDLIHATRWMVFNYISGTYTKPEVRLLYSNYPAFKYPALYQRTEDGFRWEPPSQSGLLPTDGRGIAALDFNRDGKLDVAAGNLSGPYNLYENTAGTSQRSVQIDLKSKGKTTALGARVYVTAGDETQVGYRTAEADFLSQDSRVLHFGTGNNTRVDVRVVWSDGTEQTFEDLSTGRRYVITPDGIVRSFTFE